MSRATRRAPPDAARATGLLAQPRDGVLHLRPAHRPAPDLRRDIGPRRGPRPARPRRPHAVRPRHPRLRDHRRRPTATSPPRSRSSAPTASSSASARRPLTPASYLGRPAHQRARHLVPHRGHHDRARAARLRRRAPHRRRGQPARSTLVLGITCFAALGLAISTVIPNGRPPPAPSPTAPTSRSPSSRARSAPGSGSRTGSTSSSSALPIKALTDALRAGFDPAASGLAGRRPRRAGRVGPHRRRGRPPLLPVGAVPLTCAARASVRVGVREDDAVAEDRHRPVVAHGDDGRERVVVAVAAGRGVAGAPGAHSTFRSATSLGTSRTPSWRSTPSASNTAAPSTCASA